MVGPPTTRRTSDAAHAPVRRRTHPLARDERGFSVVEVLIAVLLLAAIGAAITLASTSGMKLRGTARLQASMTKAGQQVQEDLATDRTWMGGCSAPCNVAPVIPASSLQLDDVDGTAVLVSARATPVDSPVDGVDKPGSSDRDGVVPDYYRIEIVLRPDPSLVARYAVPKGKEERRFVTSIDRRGVVQVGSLAVEVCRVHNQSDERMSIQGCAGSGASYVKMYGCPPEPRQGCTPAFNWVAGKRQSLNDPSPFVSMTRVGGGITFRLVNVSTGKTISSDAGSVKKVDGTWVFQNLESGEYRLVGLPASIGAGTERWKSKEVPAYHGSTSEPAAKASVSVEPGLKNRALVLFRPRSTKSGIDLFFRRRTETRTVGGTFETKEVAVDPWKETHAYIGGEAAAYCERAMSISGALTKLIRYDECGLSPGPGANCVTVRATYDSQIDQIYNQEVMYKYCTFYHQYFIHTYYKTTGKTARIRDGAAKTAIYEIEPKPDARVADDLSIPIDSCVTKGHKAGTPDQAVCRPAIDDLRPGLNSSIVVRPDGLIGGSNVEAAHINQNVSGTPSWMTSGGLWVYPNGTMRAANGASLPANPKVTLVGTGECYWRNPAKYSGEVEGSCNPCNPMWTRTGQLTGACTILTKTCWFRPAKEVMTSLLSDYSDEYELPTRSDCFPYNPPWKCTAVPQVVGGGNCTPPSPPPSIPQTTHPNPSNGGAAVVNSASVTASPGGA